MRSLATIWSGVEFIRTGLAGFLLLSLTACGVSIRTAPEAANSKSAPSDAPRGLTYSMKTLTLIKRVSFSKLTPTLTSGEASNFSISPALPEGLNFESTTGSIGGTPSRVFPLTNYTISANNRKGVVSTNLNLEVLTTSNSDSSVTASPNALIANDSNETMVTVALISKNGYPIKSERVSLRSNRGSTIDRIEPQYATTDSSGVATFRVRSKVAGSSTLFAFDEDDQILIVPVATVEFLPGPVHHFSFSKIALSVVAGSATEIIIAARDQYDNLCDNHSGGVDLFVSDERAIIPSSSANFTVGLAKFQNVIFKTAGVQTAQVSNGSIDLGPRNIVVNPASAHHLAFQVEPSGTAIANETISQLPTIGVFDPYDNLVDGSTVSIALTATSDENCSTPIPGALSAAQNPLNATNGLSIFQGVRILKTTAKAIKASTSTSGIASACSSPISIRSGSASLADSSIQATGPVIADGFSTLEVKILLRDASGNPISGITPSFDATDTGGANVYGLCSETDDTGNSNCTLASTKAESKTLRLTTPVEKSGSTVVFKNGAAASYLVSGFPASVSAGTTGSVTVSVLDANLNSVLDYQGIVRLSSSDPSAAVPGDFAFNPSDLGLKLISGVILKTAGTRTITATDTLFPGVSGSQSGIAVAPANHSAPHSELSAGKTTLTSGETTTLTLSLRDAYGNPDPSTEPALSDITFSSSLVGGSGTFGGVSKTGTGTYQVDFTAAKSGSATISAKIGGVSVEETLSLAIHPGIASSIVLSRISSTIQAGSAQNLTVTAKDFAGNIATGYTGAITLSSNDSAAVLESTKSLTNGVGTFSIVLKTAGSQSLGATDGDLISNLSGINVTPAAYSLATSSISTTASTIVSNHTATLTLTLRDLYGNSNPVGVPDSGYIRFTSSTSPGTGTFGSLQSQGSGVFTSVFTGVKAGVVSVSASLSNESISSNADIVVTTDVATSLALSGLPTTITAGQGFNFGISALDSNGNIVSNHSGTPVVSSSDSLATLPADQGLSSGTATRSITLKTSGNQTITVTDGSLTITSPSISVSPAAFSAAHSTLAVSSSSISSGSQGTLTLTTKDAYGNQNPSGLPATSGIAFTSSVVGGTVSFGPVTSLGSGIYSANFTGLSGGIATLSASIAGALVTGTASVTITPGTASQLVITALPGISTAGSAVSFAITAKDSNSNTVPSYGGTIQFSSTDSSATLPSASSLSGGTKTFSATLRTAGSQTLSVTDGSLSASASLTVDASGATQFTLIGVPSSATAGDSFTFTVTARDADQNIATAYAGTVSIGSTDSQAGVPSSATLIQGVGSFTVTLKTSGSKTITASDGTLSTTSNSISVSPGAVSLSQSTLATSATTLASGDRITITLTTKDAFGNQNPSGVGSVGFTSTLVGGTGSFGSVTNLGSGVYTASFTGGASGTVSLGATASSSAVAATVNVTVAPGAATRLVFNSTPSSAFAGTAFSLSYSYQDAFGNIASAQSTLPTLSSNDPLASSPSSNATLSSGSGVFTTTLKTSGSVTLTASSAGVTSATTTLSVSPGTAAKLAFNTQPSGGSAATAWAIQPVVLVQDANGNTVNSTASITLAIGTNPSAGTLLGTVTLAAVSGQASFAGLSINKSATGYTLSATSTGLASATSSIFNITAGSATRLVLSGVPSSITAGSSFNVTVTAQDSNGNTDTSFINQTGFTLSDGASPPAAAALSAGVGSFSITFTGAGSRTFTAATGNFSATSSSITVNPGAFSISKSTLGLSASSVTSGSSVTVTLTAKDDYDNLNPGGITSVAFTAGSTGGSGTFGAITNAGSGVYTALFTGNLAGVVALGATLNGKSISSAQNITVTPGALSSFALSGVPSTATAGSPFAFSVTAKDSAGNTFTGFAGQVAISSSDSAANLPASTNLSSGSGSFSVTLNTAGNQTITASSGSVQAQSGSIFVDSGSSSPAASAPSWFVQIIGGNHVCSGALISDGTNTGVLTPADCVADVTPSDLKLVFSDKTGSVASSISIHNSYDSNSRIYDVAMITPNSSSGTPLNINSDLTSPTGLSAPTLFGLDQKASYKSWAVDLDARTTDYKFFDATYMILIMAEITQAHGGFLGETSKGTSSGYLFSGFSFYQSNGTHVLINVSSQSIQAWTKETLAGATGGQSSGTVTTLAGDGTPGFEDGSASDPARARFSGPQGLIETSNGDLLIADTGNHSIRYFDRAQNTITTIAGYSGAADEADGDADTARFQSPYGMAMDPDTGTFYVSDQGGHTIRSLTISSGKATVATVAGLAFTSGFDDGDTSTATFSGPTAIAWYRGGLLILDTGNVALRYLTKGNVSTILDSKSFSKPSALAVGPNGEIYIADQGDNTIKILDSRGEVSIYAGIAGSAGFDNGRADKATFSAPSGIAVDALGNVYVSEYGNRAIRKVDTSLNVTTLAGPQTKSTPDSGKKATGGVDIHSGLPNLSEEENLNLTNGTLVKTSLDTPGNLILLSNGSMVVSDPSTNLIQQISFGSK